MIHILLIDPLDKLEVAKDSTMLLAATLQAEGEETYFLFEEDLYFTNGEEAPRFAVWSFDARLAKGSFYLERVELKERRTLHLGQNCCLHTRLDPPFDTRYLRYLWMLQALQKRYGVHILNGPQGLLLNNEKMAAYQRPHAVDSFVGTSPSRFQTFATEQAKKSRLGLVLKPLDLFQGLGVEKLSAELAPEQLKQRFADKVKECSGPVVAQPFLPEIESGEVRSLFFAGKHLGSILKIPPRGGFLSNIARGASYEGHNPSEGELRQCRDICRELSPQGIEWVAFDLLAGRVQEINITCPGLLVEVSEACGHNLALPILTELRASLDN